jgi:hypothetical protein
VPDRFSDVRSGGLCSDRGIVGRRKAISFSKTFDTQGPAIVGVHVDYRDNHELFEVLYENSIL